MGEFNSSEGLGRSQQRMEGSEQISCLRVLPCIVGGTESSVVTAESLFVCETKDIVQGHTGPPSSTSTVAPPSPCSRPSPLDKEVSPGVTGGMRGLPGA